MSPDKRKKEADEPVGVIIEEVEEGPSREELLGMEVDEGRVVIETGPEIAMDEDDSEVEEIVLGGGAEPEGPPEGERPEEKVEAKPPKVKQPRRGMALAVAVVIVLASVLGAGHYLGWMPWQVEEDAPPVAMAGHPSLVAAGEMVTFDASASTDDNGISSYTWELGDGTVLSGVQVSHFFPEARSAPYSVRLTVTDEKGQSNTSRTSVTVEPLTVDVPELAIGDRGSYNSTGTMAVDNPDGITSFDFQGSEIRLLRFDGEIEGVMVTEVVSSFERLDGFGEPHMVYCEAVSQDLNLSGTVDTESGSFALVGELSNTDRSYIDVNENVTVQKETSSMLDLEVFFYRKEWHTRDNATIYPDLGSASAGFRPTQFMRSMSIDSEDEAPHDYRDGSTLYIVTVRGADNVFGSACIRLNVTVDSATRERNGLDEFFMEFWVASGISMAVQSHVHALMVDGGNATTVDIWATMTAFDRGSGPIGHGDCQGTHFYHHISETNASYENESRAIQYAPEYGSMGSSIPWNFTIQQAISHAINETSELSGYMGNHTTAYVIDAAYAERADPSWIGVWNVTLAAPGDTDGFQLTVENSSSGPNVTLASAMIIESPPMNTTAQLGQVLTFSAAESIMMSEEGTGAAFFAGGRIDPATSLLGVEANASYASINIMTGAVVDRVAYAFTLEDVGGSTMSAVNARTGQWMYVHEHEGDASVWF